jgi:hypothetical protein
MSTTSSFAKDKIISLLGNSPHLPLATVASACGVTESYVSQVSQDPDSKAAIAELRLKTLERATKLDQNYDKLEEALQRKLAEQLPMIYKPDQAIRAIQVINGAKRRGVVADSQNFDAARTVQLNLPQAFINSFTLNINNQVVSTGSQDLTTLPTSQLAKLASAKSAGALPAPNQLEDANVLLPNESPVQSSQSI